MNPLSARIRRHRAPQRPLPDPHQAPSASRRRSSRIETRQRCVSIPYPHGSHYESQSHLEQQQKKPHFLQPLKATLYTCVPNPSSVEASAPVPSRAQVQEYPGPSQANNHQSRKRRPDRSIDTRTERDPKRARLTKENLQAFEKTGGQGMKSRKEPRSNSSQTRHLSRSSAATESSSRTASTTDSSFPRLVFENGVLDPLNSGPPENLGYLQDRLNRARDTESPSESEYQDFVYRTQEAPNEQTMLLETSKLLKDYGRGYRRVYNQALNDFPKSVGFNTGLSAPQPDMIEGLDLREFKPFPVRQELGRAAVPTSENNATILPHLAGEWKAGGKDMVQARTQAAYDGACMVYGRNEARLFLESPDPAGHAYVQTFTTDGTTLNTFAHYSSESQDEVKYYQYPTSSSFLILSYEDFKQSRRRLRNQQDSANEMSVQLRDELNKKWLANHPSPLAPSSPAETADSIAANDDEYEDGADPTNQLLTEYWTNIPTSNQYNSSVQIPAVDNVYAPPSTTSQENSENQFVQIPAANSVHASLYESIPPNNEDDPFRHISTGSDRNASLDSLTFSPITPPQSSNDTLLPFELIEGIDLPGGSDNKRTLQTRKSTITVDGRRTRRKYKG